MTGIVTKKRITTASAKAKGRNLQKEVVAAILAQFPELEPDDVKSCPMGSNGLDVQLSPAGKRAFPFAVECKRRKSIALVYDALEQADQKDGRTPIAVIKADRKKSLVTISLVDFMKLLRKADTDNG